MLTITLLTVGTIKETYLQLAIQDYVNRMKPLIHFHIIEVKEEHVKNAQQAVEKESLAIKKLIDPKSYVMVFDLQGGQLTSEQFASELQSITSSHSHITMIIGGSHGVTASLRQSAHRTISFSQLTFPHQLFRLLVCEQLYRALMIQKGHPYHK
jgi:23S rRNA (pseudouridine1915-N3)-methyltransferase